MDYCRCYWCRCPISAVVSVLALLRLGLHSIATHASSPSPAVSSSSNEFFSVLKPPASLTPTPRRATPHIHHLGTLLIAQSTENMRVELALEIRR
ncbi:MAG: hypothetical protein J3R72DRAFT_435468 [Linnemannia gamsii]|nr:MAG: hypothetical protein J3R72DRAFT_435468 [Linnemannia gamsii]